MKKINLRILMLVAVFGLAFTLLMSTKPTKAQSYGLCFDNRTPETVWVAISYYSTYYGDWVNEGWWTLSPFGYSGSYRCPLTSRLTHSYYYFYAVSDRGASPGTSRDCISNSRFRITTYQCNWPPSGYYFVNFQEIYVGNHDSYTMRLWP